MIIIHNRKYYLYLRRTCWYLKHLVHEASYIQEMNSEFMNLEFLFTEGKNEQVRILNYFACLNVVTYFGKHVPSNNFYLYRRISNKLSYIIFWTPTQRKGNSPIHIGSHTLYELGTMLQTGRHTQNYFFFSTKIS